MSTRSFISKIAGQANDQENAACKLVSFSAFTACDSASISNCSLLVYSFYTHLLFLSPFLLFQTREKIKPRLSHFMEKSLAWRENYQISSVAALFRTFSKINIDFESVRTESIFHSEMYVEADSLFLSLNLQNVEFVKSDDENES